MEKYNLANKKIIERILKKLCSEGFHCFASESQFRDLFALMIGRNHEDFVIIPEFSPPKDICPETDYFKSKKSIHFDLLVIDKATNKKYLFEFKYKTRALEDVKIANQRFDLNNQNDFTNGRYDVWEDIYRIEQFINLENDDMKIDCGYVLFLTNYETYLTKPHSTCKSYNFSLEEKVHQRGIKKWKEKNNGSKGNEKELKIAKDYKFEHKRYSTVNGSKFKYLLVRVCK